MFDKKYENGGMAFVKVDTQEKAWAPGLCLVFLKECFLFKSFFLVFFSNSSISQLSKEVYDVLYDSGCNLGSHVPWKEVPGSGGKLPLLRPTSYKQRGDENQEAANRLAKAKSKGKVPRSTSMEILGLVVFFPTVHVFHFFFF